MVILIGVLCTVTTITDPIKFRKLFKVKNCVVLDHMNATVYAMIDPTLLSDQGLYLPQFKE